MSTASFPRRSQSGTRSRADGGPYSPLRDPTVLALIAIVVGALALWAVGIGTPLTGGGDGGGPIFPVEDYDNGSVADSTPTTAPTVRLSANRTTLRAGEGVRLRVTGPDGDPVNATLDVAGRTYRTGEDGVAVVTLASGGSVTVVARPAAGDLRPATADLRVRPRRIGLAVRVLGDRVRVGDPVTVQVLRRDTGAPVAATVVVNGTRRPTGPDGRLQVTFDRGGTATIEASKAGNATVTFRPVEETVRVRRRAVDLRLFVVGEEFLVGQRPVVAVRRADTGASVNATVVVAGETFHTGPGGVLRLPSLPAGNDTVQVRASPTPRVRYRPDAERIRVRRERVLLTVTVTPGTIRAGERATVTVRRADTGAPVNATVQVGGRAVRTGPDGRVAVPFDGYGEVRVRATKPPTAAERFRPAAATVTVLGADLAVVDADLPGSVAPGDPAVATVTVRNRGNAAGTTAVVYRIAGRPVATRTVTVLPGESRTVRLVGAVPPWAGGVAVQSVSAAGTVVVGPLRVGNATADNASLYPAVSRVDTAVVVRTGRPHAAFAVAPGYSPRAVDKTSHFLSIAR